MHRTQGEPVAIYPTLTSHLATMQVTEIDDFSCQLDWTTEIDPEIFAEAIHQGMLISIEGIKKTIKHS